MKLQAINKVLVPATLSMFSFAILVANFGCQKEKTDTEKSVIAYTNVSPDSSLNYSQANYYDFDFNKDNITDYRLIVTGGTAGNYLCKYIWNACELDTYNEDSVAVNTIDSFFNPLNAPLKDPLALNQNDIIDGKLTWEHDAVTNPYADLGLFLVHYKPTLSCSAGSFTGVWKNVSDKYLGLKLKLNGTFYYGWIRLSTGPKAQSMIIKEYAYNSIPNQPILAGQTK